MKAFSRNVGLALTVLFIAVGTGTTQEKMTATSGPVNEKEIIPNLDLSYLSPNSIYSFSASSDEPLKIQLVDPSETLMLPASNGFNGQKQEKESTPFTDTAPVHPTSETANPGTAVDPLTKTTTYVSYSGMFSTAYYSWNCGFDFNYSDFTSYISTHSSNGWRTESMDIYPNTANNASLYGGTWVQDSQGGAWALNYNSSDFIALLNSYGQSGYRIKDIEYDLRSQLYGGVWVVDGKGWSWVLNYDYTQFLQELQNQQNAGRRPIDFRIYSNPSGTAFLYSGVWVSNTEGYAWTWVINYNWTDFQALLTIQNAAGQRLIDYEVYRTAQGVQYAGCWVNDYQAGGYSLNYSDGNSFLTQINTWRDSYGQRPLSLEMFTDFGSAVEDGPAQIRNFELAQNYPNPFNPSTTFHFAIPEAAFVTLKIYNLLGNEVATLVEENRQAGVYEVPFHADHLPSGIYLCRMEAQGNTTFVQTRKVSLLK